MLVVLGNIVMGIYVPLMVDIMVVVVAELYLFHQLEQNQLVVVAVVLLIFQQARVYYLHYLLKKIVF